MNWSKFYYDFAAAYGTFWLIVMGLAVLTQSHINAGTFGLVGFPILAGFYAYQRSEARKSEDKQQEDNEARRKLEMQRLNERLNRLEDERDPIAPSRGSTS